MHRNNFLNLHAATRAGSSPVKAAYQNAQLKVPSHDDVKQLVDNNIWCVHLIGNEQFRKLFSAPCGNLLNIARFRNRSLENGPNGNRIRLNTCSIFKDDSHTQMDSPLRLLLNDSQ